MLTAWERLADAALQCATEPERAATPLAPLADACWGLPEPAPRIFVALFAEARTFAHLTPAQRRGCAPRMAQLAARCCEVLALGAPVPATEIASRPHLYWMEKD